MKFFTLVVNHEDDCRKCWPPAPRPPICAFQVMMRLQPVEHPKKQREKLKNSILNLFANRGCQFVGANIYVATSLVNKLCDLLWYLDGQYMKIENKLPLHLTFPNNFVKYFSAFNQPELMKHRKKRPENLSEVKLSKLCVDVWKIIQALPCMDQMAWAP